MTSKLRRKKNKIYLANPKEKTNFAPDDESLKRLVAQHRVFFDAVYSRMWNRVRLPIRNPIFPQSPKLPLDKEKLRYLAKLRKKREKNMSKILYEVYKNDIQDSESVMYGKWYARLKSIETLSMTKLAKHIAEHGSVFTEDVVEGVMKKFKTCLLEMLLESKKVKILGLGTFYLTCECQKGGADKEQDFNVTQHLKALHIRFLPDQTAEDNISSREFIKKAEFVNIKNLLSAGTADTEEETSTDPAQGGGTDGNSGDDNTGSDDNTGGGPDMG